MEVATAIAGRRSIRSYRATPVEEEKLNRILEAARLSPSAGNRQEWKFIVVREPKTRSRLAQAACDQKFVADAPVVLVACATESSKIMTCGQPAYTVDLSIACSYMILQAWELGLGTCWLAAFREEEVKSILGIPEAVRVVAMTPLGYPERPVSPRPRKRLEEIVCFERYS